MEHQIQDTSMMTLRFDYKSLITILSVLFSQKCWQLAYTDFISSLYLQLTCINATDDSQDTLQLSKASLLALWLPLTQN